MHSNFFKVDSRTMQERVQTKGVLSISKCLIRNRPALEKGDPAVKEGAKVSFLLRWLQWAEFSSHGRFAMTHLSLKQILLYREQCQKVHFLFFLFLYGHTQLCSGSAPSSLFRVTSSDACWSLGCWRLNTPTSSRQSMYSSCWTPFPDLKKNPLP